MTPYKDNNNEQNTSTANACSKNNFHQRNENQSCQNVPLSPLLQRICYYSKISINIKSKLRLTLLSTTMQPFQSRQKGGGGSATYFLRQGLNVKLLDMSGVLAYKRIDFFSALGCDVMNLKCFIRKSDKKDRSLSYKMELGNKS